VTPSNTLLQKGKEAMKRGMAVYLLPAVADPQVYTVTVQVTDSSGRIVAEGSACVPADGAIVGNVLSFRPVADSWVDETRPDLNLGGGDALCVNGAALKIPYLRFEVTGLTGRVQSAWLELEAIGSSSDGGTIHAVSDNRWDEFGITYNNRPVVDGPPLDTVRAVSAGDFIVLDVTPAIRQDGLHTFAIASSRSDGWAVRSRKGSVDTPMLFVALEPRS
jgi:hypothetical protein